VTDPEKIAQWQSDAVESKQTSEGPIGVGATMRDVRQLMGRRMESDVEVIAYEPNKTFNIKNTSGPVQFEIRHIFESVDGGTKVTLVAEAEPGGFFKLAEPMVARSTQKQFDSNFADFADLKKLLEA
jgi:hypothetical protein